MKDFRLKKKASQFLVKSARIMTLNDAMKACPMFAYQPKHPKISKELK